MSGDVVMVTGGSGFVGSHLVEFLLGKGCRVHVFDRVPLDRAMNLAAVRDHPDLHYVAGDLRDAGAVQAFYRADAACLYHLASVVGVRKYMDDPLALIDVVVGGTRTLLDLAAAHGTRVLFTSTSEIYGKNPDVPWNENGDRVLGPTSVDRWSYSSSKAVCEHMLYALGRKAGLPFSIVRFFNVYGPRQSSIYVVSQSVYRALRGEAPSLYDDGRQTRCFTYIDDAIEGVWAVSREPKALGEAFNLGNPVETAMRVVIDLIIKEAGSGVASQPFDTSREYGDAYEDIRRRVPSVDKAARLLGWRPAVPLEEGIRRTVAWARDNAWWLADHSEQKADSDNAVAP